MRAPCDLRSLVLHGLRLKGVAAASAVVEAAGLHEADAKPELDRLVEEGLATYRQGRLSGYALTAAGRQEHARRLADELEATGRRDDVRAAYQRFLAINQDLLGICTAWQLREVDGASVVNDHGDPAHDAAVIERLEDLHARVTPVCQALAAALERFVPYGERLAHALERVRAGDRDWFTKPMLPSYHTVWFELHEDLLATLGIERSSEVVA
jgi:DNA-binding PadR family transcriptional regulator